ncbi:uncharacterized protein Gasu_43240 [Galdieria sulphuraria]|uniref:Uncharacterized protein n=1 Tax=Galdieria sulphuraria TaxID=130081 RepID=M2XDT4_GALSU|nr:uncharacterized protein Gasu_43240 [Galdieria sulphuraria]EME28157.1 hypothetical protein Gasu_43240 [Galdieria sulphuraria]|eukprot:XP_005704677.1 hypothetical protein Gasu_43240 [Galdieria sulphuraria]
MVKKLRHWNKIRKRNQKLVKDNKYRTSNKKHFYQAKKLVMRAQLFHNNTPQRLLWNRFNRYSSLERKKKWFIYRNVRTSIEN